MPELLIDFITSLDGYGAADGWPGWWGLEGPGYLAWSGDQPEADYTVLIGANTYRVMSGLASEGEPGTGGLGGAVERRSSRTFDGRIQLLEYVPTVLAGPPGATKADA